MMGKRGPKTKPTKLKVLEGNKGKRKLNDAEPKFTSKIPECPRHLDKVAREEWFRITPELKRFGLITLADRSALAAYCQNYSSWVAAQKKIASKGYYAKGSVPDTTVVAPWVKVANEAMKLMKVFLIEFGLTPSARSNLKIKSEEEKSLEELLG